MATFRKVHPEAPPEPVEACPEAPPEEPPEPVEGPVEGPVEWGPVEGSGRRVGTGTVTISPLARYYINDVLDKGWLSYGEYSRRFEQEFANLHGCKYGILSNSGTSSLLVALQAMKEIHGWRDGDEVIHPAVTFVAGINVTLQAGLKPVLVDVEREYYCIDPALIERVITPRTKAIMPVHLFGQPCDMELVTAIAKAYNLKVIEDGCEAAFATYQGKSISSWGDIGCHSFYAAHIIVAGVGGISLTNDRDYATKMRSLTNHGLAYEYLSKSEEFDPDMLSRYFVFDTVGHSFRVTEMEAALGVAQLQDRLKMVTRRQENFWYLKESLKELDQRGLIQLPKVRDCVSYCPMMFPIITLTEPKNGLMAYLTQRGIGVRDTLPLINQPVYKGLFNEVDYPIAKMMNEQGLYCGVHHGLEWVDLDYIAQCVIDYYG